MDLEDEGKETSAQHRRWSILNIFDEIVIGLVSDLHLEQSFKDLPRFLVLLVLWLPLSLNH